MPKYKTLKEIHQYLIDNNMFHGNENYITNKKILNKMLEEDNYKEISPALFKEGEIYSSERDL